MTAAAWLLLAAFAPILPGQDGPRQRIERLDAAEPGTDLEEIWSALLLDGAAAALAALEEFSGEDVFARRARARLLVEVGAPESIDGVLANLGDPDPEVRRSLAEALGARSLATGRSEERGAALFGLASDDPDRGVRSAAREAMARAALPGTPAALDDLLDRVPVDEALEVAQALVASSGGRTRLFRRVRSMFAGQQELDDEIVAVLLRGYGRALAEIPRGGRDPADRLPFVRGFVHPSESVRLAAYTALTRMVARLAEFGEYRRADVLMERLSEEGLPRHDLLYRRVSLALSRRGDGERALELARALADAAELAPVEERETYRLYALHYQGAAHFALGDLAAAREDFEQVKGLLRHLLEQRLDLPRGPRAFAGGFQELGGRIMIDRLELLVLEDLWIALTELAEGVEVSDRKLLERVRSAHETLLLARVIGMSTDVQSGSTFASVLGRDLAPGPLVIDVGRVRLWSDGRGDDLLGKLGRALRTVAAWEVPGFEPAAGLDPADALDRRLIDPLFDRARFALYLRFRDEYQVLLQRQLREVVNRGDATDEAARESLWVQLSWLREEISKERDRVAAVDDPWAQSPEELLTIFHGLADLASQQSLLAQVLAANLRNDGRTVEARLLAQRLLAQLRDGMPGAQAIWTEWASAQAELTIGSTYTDEGRAAEAETVFLSAVRRFEEIENARMPSGANGANPANDAGLRQVRQARANALLSLAVNANVRMQDTERALAFFERAFELDQRDFMQALLACYRARSGRDEEARAVLRTLRPSPSLYYNLACTHALLGDAREAVDYLQRELEENHPTAGSLARQKEWARGDPDLASLRQDPAFRRLVGLD